MTNLYRLVSPEKLELYDLKRNGKLHFRKTIAPSNFNFKKIRLLVLSAYFINWDTTRIENTAYQPSGNVNLFASKSVFGKHNLITTIHRAIDVCQNPNEALEKLINIGVDRILTSGQQKKAIDGISIIQSMIERCKSKIEIMPGSGINETNALQFVNIGAKSVHFTARKSIENNNDFGFGADYEFDLLKFNTINNLLN